LGEITVNFFLIRWCTGAILISKEVTIVSTKKPRFTITMDEELFERVETYRFEHRLRSQSQAVVSLVESGIASLLDETKTSPGPANRGKT
jgi:hypothetical protein